MPVSNMEDAVTLGVSVAPGRVINPEIEESIDIRFTYDDTRVIPWELEIALLDTNDAVVGEPVTIEGSDLDKELPAIDTTSLEDGLYYIRLRVYDKDNQLIKESLTPFFDSRIHIQVKGIEVYPPEFFPGSSGLVFPDVDAPDDVWIRWSLDDTLLSEGTLESYASGLTWNAPGVEGVYTLKMEVFPFTSPPSVSSSLYTDVQIFVTRNILPDKFDLSPGEQYTSLLNLNGTLKDEGMYRNSAVLVGSPVLSLVDGGFGYLFSEGDGIEVNSNVLPDVGGRLSPFSAVFRFRTQGYQRNKVFMIVRDHERDLFSIKTDAYGFFTAVLRQDTGIIEDISEIDPSFVSELTISVIPAEDSVAFLWYGDGKLIRSELYSYSPLHLTSGHEGSTILGGAAGFTGFLDYFGIYYRDVLGRPGVDDSIFHRTIGRSEHSDYFILAEGFDGLYLPENLSLLNRDNEGISVKWGDLIIAPENGAVIMETELDFTLITMEAEIPEDERDGVFVLSILHEGEQVGGTTVNFPRDKATAGISLTLDHNIMKITGQNNDTVSIPFAKGNRLKISIDNRSTTGPLRIASILVDRKGKKIVENKTADLKSSL